MQNDRIPLYDSKAVQEIFGISESTFYRWLRESREGQGRLPLPLPLGKKRKLLWNAEQLRLFCEAQSQAPPLPLESTAEREQELADSLKSLQEAGVRIGTAKGGAR